MKRYCKNKNILIEETDYLNCDSCNPELFSNEPKFAYCGTRKIVTKSLDTEYAHQKLVKIYIQNELRKKKLERILK